jgi:betaine reductase
MKFPGHISHGMPVLEDILAGSAMMIEKDDRKSPVLRMDSVGTHRIGAGGGQTQILEELVAAPLKRLGLRYSDVDKYATEMHNPEVTEPSGSGNVPELNYKLIAALAVRAGEIARSDMPAFATRHGMPGFSPTQGHIASAIPFMPHAIDGLTNGSYRRVMFLAKGSLFLGRMTQMADGLSFMMESQS